MKKPKSKTKQYIEENPIEQLIGIGRGVADEILGVTHGDLSEGEILDLRKIHEEDQTEAKTESDAEKALDIEPGIDYSKEIVHVGEWAVKQENRELEAQLRELMTEIKKLADSSKELQMQFKDVAVEQHAATPGKYHKSFFSWLLSVIRNARMQVEDSGAWLLAMHSKKKSRDYGSMAKKHGTSFTLNNERTVATQVG